jgi:hypothetical protein
MLSASSEYNFCVLVLLTILYTDLVQEPVKVRQGCMCIKKGGEILNCFQNRRSCQSSKLWAELLFWELGDTSWSRLFCLRVAEIYTEVLGCAKFSFTCIPSQHRSVLFFTTRLTKHRKRRRQPCWSVILYCIEVGIDGLILSTWHSLQYLHIYDVLYHVTYVLRPSYQGYEIRVCFS